jgi:glycosyltransferase involved in cell wall biosynthesis
MRVLFWGTYDTGKPRTRILLCGLRENGVNVTECHTDVWGGVEDKSQLKGPGNKLRFGLRWLVSYPPLVWRFLRQPKPDVVVIGYLGQLDVLVLWPFAKLRGVPVVWDAFLSLYNTVVEDRRLLGPRNPVAWLIYAWEWLACRAAERVLIDTRAHGEYFVERFRLPAERVKAVLVGAEAEVFKASAEARVRQTETDSIQVLFYGQFIPLHGIETIVAAARLAEQENIEWTLVGCGQEEEKIRRMLEQHPLSKVNWITWVKYEDLVDCIHRADVCLGIFGDTDKAARVIPNKVFQILTAGAPLVTRDSAAIRELVSAESCGLALVPPADPAALVAAIRHVAGDVRREDRPLHRSLAGRIVPVAIGERIMTLIGELGAVVA